MVGVCSMDDRIHYLSEYHFHRLVSLNGIYPYWLMVALNIYLALFRTLNIVINQCPGRMAYKYPPWFASLFQPCSYIYLHAMGSVQFP